MEISKWSEKKLYLDELAASASSTIKISNSSHFHIIDLLKKILNDNNIVVVTTAVKITGFLVKGLRKHIQNSSKMLFGLILEKFKEKNKLLIDECQKTLETFFFSINNFEDVLDEINEALSSKSLGMKTNSLNFVNKFIEKKCMGGNKKEINKYSNFFKNLLQNIKKLTDENNGELRDSALVTIGKIKGIFGEKIVGKSLIFNKNIFSLFINYLIY